MSSSAGVALFGPPRCVVCRTRADWLCRSCRAEARAPQEPISIPHVVQGLAPWAYEGGPRSLILALKVRGLRGAAGPLIEAMLRSARSARWDADTVSWVPARRKDKVARGFDHAEVLARGVAEGLGLPAAPLLRRRGHQLDQVGLDRKHRLTNLAQAFETMAPVSGAVLLVDDLVTTGATAACCADALTAAGVQRVDLLAACRR